LGAKYKLAVFDQVIPTASNADAQSWINRVYANGGTVSTATANAVNTFIEGCVSDGIWGAMQSVGLLCGASNLVGALTPLKGTAPTNVNFVSGDYNRQTGLLGNGSTKYLNSNRNNNADPQDSKHAAVYAQTATTSAAGTFPTYIGTGGGAGGAFVIGRLNSNSTSLFVRHHNATNDTIASAGSAAGLIGASRSGSANYTFRHSGSNSTVTRASQTPFNGSMFVFSDFSSGSSASTSIDCRLSFYSIGSAIDLALLDARVTALVTAIGATAS
jgi:hypothetical protein